MIDATCGMTTYGQRLGARHSAGFANWSEEIVDSPTSGMCNFVSQQPHPNDGLRRRVEILIHNRGEWQVAAYAKYDGNCRLSDFVLTDCAILNIDSRVRSLVKQYSGKVGTLDCLSMQREYPLQSPYHSWLLLRPGEVEVIA